MKLWHLGLVGVGAYLLLRRDKEESEDERRARETKEAEEKTAAKEVSLHVLSQTRDNEKLKSNTPRGLAQSLGAKIERDKHFPPELREKIYTKIMAKQFAEDRTLSYAEIMEIVMDEWRQFPRHYDGGDLLGIPGTPLSGETFKLPGK